AQGRAVSQAEGARLQRTLPRRNRFTIASRRIPPTLQCTQGSCLLDPKPGPVAGGGPSQRNQGGGCRRRRRPGDIRGEGPPPATGPVGRRRCLRSNASRKKPGARPGCFASGKV